MADTCSYPGMDVYRLRVVIAGISPLIWRRLEVAAGTTVTGLHACQVRLAGLGLREGERFVYEYNFSAAWRVDLRVEQIACAQPGRAYPRCTGGRRAGPPEDWDGPWAFLERTQPHLVLGATVRAAEIIGQLLDARDHHDLADAGADREELAALMPLLSLERFGRRTCNQALCGLAVDVQTVEGSRR